MPRRNLEQQQHAGHRQHAAQHEEIEPAEYSTSQPAEALMKVRGTAIRLVNSASWVAV
jgi:hypothetical protein